VRAQLWWTTLLIAGVFCAIAFYAKGGLNVPSMITTEIVLTLGAGAIVAAGVWLAPSGARAYGLWPAGLLLAFAALSALSIAWSVQPEYSWLDSGRLFAYGGVFCAGVALVRIARARWPAVLGGLALAAVVVCAYALATKVFPAGLAASDTYARLNEPYGYWNAVGLSAAMGVICCMWLGARRGGHALLRALAYPAVGLLLLTLVLAYSRGALAALAVGLALWFWVVPLRMRSAALLIVGALGAGVVLAWDFSEHALASEAVPLAERVSAGHQLGVLVAVMVLALAIVGVAVGFATGRRAPSLQTRKRAGAALLAVIALAVLAFLGALAHSQRGLTGTISHDLGALTNPNAKPPPNTPGRLTAVASVRARYWKEALQVFDAHPLLGAGAEGYRTAHLRYEDETLEVRHAHGFIVQTLADLGLAGLAVALALLFSWLLAAARATHLLERSWTRWDLRTAEPIACTPERVGLLAMLCVVVVFGAHSLIDWTWYVPGDACVALVCVGWLAGRGPLAARNGARRTQPRASSVRLALTAAALIAALLAAWSQWQPQRSEDARQEALQLLAADTPAGARAAAERAVSRNPLSVEALFTLATVEQRAGQPALARATLERAVRLQPSNPQTWLELGRYRLSTDPKAAATDLQAAIYLDPESIAPEAIAAGKPEAIELHNEYIQALQASEAASAAHVPTKPSAAHGPAKPSAALKSARGSRARAAPGESLVARLRALLERSRSRTARGAR
jgi:O-antigen ligase/Tfp pilus assembly protein PilF